MHTQFPNNEEIFFCCFGWVVWMGFSCAVFPYSTFAPLIRCPVSAICHFPTNKVLCTFFSAWSPCHLYGSPKRLYEARIHSLNAKFNLLQGWNVHSVTQPDRQVKCRRLLAALTRIFVQSCPPPHISHCYIGWQLCIHYHYSFSLSQLPLLFCFDCCCNGNV